MLQKCLIVAIGLLGPVAITDAQDSGAVAERTLRTRKSVTIYADNEAEASARAQSRHPNCTVDSVRRVSKGVYRVVLWCD